VNTKKIKLTLSISVATLILLVILPTIIYNQYVYMRLDTSRFPLEQKWSSRVDAKILELSVTNDGKLVFARTASRLYAIDAQTGQEVWSFTLSYQIDSSPAIAVNENIYIADSKTLWALNQKNGDVIWRQPLSKVNEQVIAASDTAILVCSTSSNVSAYDPKNGSLLWKFPVYWHHEKFYVNKNTIYVPEDGVYAINLPAGQVVREKGTDAVTDSRFYNDIIYYVTTEDIVAFNTQNESEIWRHNLQLSEYGLPKIEVYDKFILVMDMKSVFKLNRDTGKLIWKVSASEPSNPSIIGDDIFVLEEFDKTIRSFQIENGKDTGSLKFSGYQILVADSRQNMVAFGDMLFFVRGNEILGFAPKGK